MGYIPKIKYYSVTKKDEIFSLVTYNECLYIYTNQEEVEMLVVGKE